MKLIKFQIFYLHLNFFWCLINFYILFLKTYISRLKNLENDVSRKIPKKNGRMKSNIKRLNCFLEGAWTTSMVYFNALQNHPTPRKKPVSEAIEKCKAWFNRASFPKPREIC